MNAVCGPVDPSPASVAVHRPLGLREVGIFGGLWGRWRRANRLTSLVLGIEQLETAGNLTNLRLAAAAKDGAAVQGEYRGPVYMDSDVTKLVEAAAWDLVDEPDPGLRSFVDRATELLERAQEDDGYLHSYHQVKRPGRRYASLEGSHELYCAGHLAQAAVAARRGLGDERLERVARRLGDHLVREFLDGGNPSLDGHPQVETALVELYRLTGTDAYLRLAGRFVDERGRRRLGRGGKGAENYQDHLPVREAPTLLGHAVRALYLEAGVVDVYLETGDESLLRSSVARWEDMVAAKTSITGGQGSRLLREAFGDRYELPPDLSFNETCTAVAAVHWSWRLLLATGQARYAELVERTLYNGFAAATSADGARFFKGNPLQRRPDHHPFEHAARRSTWFWSACCPPNVSRLLSSLGSYVATKDDDTLYLQLFGPGVIRTPMGGGAVELEVDTDYPWDDTIGVTVRRTPAEPWALALRIPSWSRRNRLQVGNDAYDPEVDGRGYAVLRRHWRSGDEIRLRLDLTPRLTHPHPRLDAVRGCVAIERGPLVYCVEQVDQPGDTPVDALTLRPGGRLRPVAQADLDGIGRTVTLELDAEISMTLDEPGLPYFANPPRARGRNATAIAIPYFQWDNRDGGAMRVWIPYAA